MSEILKICKRCLETKEGSEFNKQSKSKDGFKSICKQCDKDLNARRYKTKKSDIILQVKEWQRNNFDKVQTIKKKYYASKKKNEEIKQPSLSSENTPILPINEVAQSSGVTNQSLVV